MPARTVTIGNTGRERMDGTPLAGAPVVVTLVTSGGRTVKDTNTDAAIDKAALSTTMDAAGAWSMPVVAPVDTDDPFCYYQVNENNGSITNSPHFAYTTDTLDVADWQVTAVTTDLVQMRMPDEFFSTDPAPGKTFRFWISKDTTWTPAGGSPRVLDSTAYIDIKTDTGGNATVYLPPSSLLADATAHYAVRTPAGSIYFYDAPDTTSDPLGENILEHITSFSIVGSTEVPGPAGPAGPAGAAGPTGPAGAAGPTGPAGSGSTVAVQDGTTTVSGAATIHFSSGAVVSSGGAGIASVAVSGGSATPPAWVSYSADHTVGPGEDHLLGVTTAGTLTFTMPDATAGPRRITLKNYSLAPHPLLAAAFPLSGQTFDGVAGPLSLDESMESVTLVNDGADWAIE